MFDTLFLIGVKALILTVLYACIFLGAALVIFKMFHVRRCPKTRDGRMCWCNDIGRWP